MHTKCMHIASGAPVEYLS